MPELKKPLETSFQMSQGYDVIPPRRGRAYPILCEEWEHVKNQIRLIKTSFDLYYAIGSLLVGVGITTLISILLGAYAPASATDLKAIIAWAVTAVALILGAGFLYFARESSSISQKQAHEVIGQMELIEKRYCEEGVEIATAAESTFIAPKKASTFEIIKAIYWTPKASLDVTEELKKLVVNDKLEITVTNRIKDDPDVGTTKTLSVLYEVNGVIQTKEVSEHEHIEIP